MLKLVSKQFLSKNEVEAKMLLNGTYELEVYTFKDGDGGGTSVSYNSIDVLYGDEDIVLDGLCGDDLVDLVCDYFADNNAFMLELVKEAYGRVLRLEDEGYAFDVIMNKLDEFFASPIIVSIYDKFLGDKALTDDESKLLIDAFAAFIKFKM